MRNCNCSNSIKQNKDEIRERAIKFAIMEEVDVQIHSWTERGKGRLWDFEPKGSIERGKGLIEIIKFRDHKSKDVLQDSERAKLDSKKSGKSNKPVSGGTRKRSKPVKQKVDRSDESSGRGKSKDSAPEVD